MIAELLARACDEDGLTDLAESLREIARRYDRGYLRDSTLFEIQPGMARKLKGSPPYYQAAGVEPLDVLRDQMTPEVFAEHCRATALAYLWRAGRKGPALEDFVKAERFVQEAIAALALADGGGDGD